jgi:lipoprotein NlpD
VPPSTGTPPSPAAAHTRPAAAPIADAATAQVGGLRWRWPTQGEVIDRFSAGDITRQGIDIAGSSGQAVVAAADGEVVYSGSGLRGYGELVIVKHSPQFLSAYGHNRTRLVNEGERVQAGQPIAELGRTGADRDKLHFEIRRDGRPVDPLQYLPRR